MHKYNSIVYRLTGLSFLLLLSAIAILLFLVNLQMSQHFSMYLQHNGMMMGMGHHMMQGAAEQHFLTAVHQSLIWVGLVILAVSVLISYFVARSITRPLCQLQEAARSIKEGTLGKTVAIEREDEVGMLARTINDMSLQLEQNEQMRRQLFAGIAHELRTPLAIIQGNLEGLIDDVIPPDKALFLSLEEEVLRVNRLVQDLRDMSLAEINELELHKEPLSMNALLSRAVSMLQPLIDEKSLSVQLNLQESLPLLLLDKDRINQVIYNILSNAIRYIPAGSAIHIRTEEIHKKDRPWLQLVIADTGTGIAAADLPHVFQYFYRGEKSRSRKSGGSGIGLALARQFVLSHGGTIDVVSEEGKGTVFTIEIPYEK